MLFYKVIMMLPEEEYEAREENVRHERKAEQKRALQIQQAAVECNEEMQKAAYCFVSGARDSEIVCGMTICETEDITKLIRSFTEKIRHVLEVKYNEITFSTWKNLLQRAYRNDLIEDVNYVIEDLELDVLDRVWSKGFCFSEYMISGKCTFEQVCEKAEELMSGETFIPELERIFQGSKGQISGHPVHYMVEADTCSVRKDFLSILFESLYENDRLKSRRYSWVDIDPHRTLGHSFDLFYKSSKGGAVVVECPYEDDVEEDDHADTLVGIIDMLCRTMLKYRHQVLTVFCLPRECKRTKRLLYENLGSVSMIELREDLADHECACSYLKTMCSKKDIDPDTELYGNLDLDKKYLPDELRKVFDEWYNKKLKTVVFPQYKDITACRSEAVKKIAKGCAYDELNEMVGLSNAKNVIIKALNYYKMQRIYQDKGIRRDHPAMHMVFTGNPGTAKTTVARLFARIMKENELLSKGHLVEVGRSDLIARYVGWTAKTVKEKFKAASGGVLFIDEAYSLVDDRGGSFGDEAINTIVQEMENHREDMVVIFAGYPDKMEDFLNKNPGLRSRIAFHVPFEDYGTEELCSIAKLIGKSKGISFTDGAVKKLSGVFDKVRLQTDFGNGRYVRNIIELSRMNQADRILSLDPDKVSEKMLMSIEEADIEVPVIAQTPLKRTIGFAV